MMTRWRLGLIVVFATALGMGGWRLGAHGASSTPPARLIAPPASQANVSSADAPDSPASDSSDVSGLDEMLESENGALTDLVSHLKHTCTAAPRLTAGQLTVSAVEACVANAEQAANLVNLISESVASAAGAEMPSGVRARWEKDLASDKRSINKVLTPVGHALAYGLASGQEPPGDFRALGHLRDRIGRVLAAVGP